MMGWEAALDKVAQEGLSERNKMEMKWESEWCVRGCQAGRIVGVNAELEVRLPCSGTSDVFKNPLSL